MGPCRMSDLAATTSRDSSGKRQYAEDPGAPHSQIADVWSELGRLARKCRGYYRYAPEGREALPDPEVERDHPPHRQERGAHPAAYPKMMKRQNAACSRLINEGAKILRRDRRACF